MQGESRISSSLGRAGIQPIFSTKLGRSLALCEWKEWETQESEPLEVEPWRRPTADVPAGWGLDQTWVMMDMFPCTWLTKAQLAD